MAYLFILFAVIMRLIPHIPNATPVMALALFGGTYLDKRFALLVPLAAMIMSDVFIGMHALVGLTWGCVLITGYIGLWVRRQRSVSRIVVATLLSSITFFVVTNFGVWFATGLYARTFAGLMTCFSMALPFFRNELLGNCVYVSILFSTFTLAQYMAAKRLAVKVNA